MPKEHSCTGYNARNPHMASLRIRRWHMRLVFWAVLFMATSAMASDWSAHEKQLAAKIIAVTGQSALSVHVENRSSLSQAEAAQIKSELLFELTSLDARLADSNQAATSVQITLSEQLQNYVWVAEIHRDSQPASVVLISIPYSEVSASAQNSGMFSIHKLLLWSQPEKVLDAVISSPQRAIILSADSVSILRFQNGEIWQLEQSLPISHEQPWPRDLRGLLVLRTDHLFDVYLPGVFCQSTASSPFALNCAQSNAPWPLSPEDSTASASFASGQNFFTGTVTLDKGAPKSVPAFFSAALLVSPENSVWVLSGVDGHAYIADNAWAYKAAAFNVGSDIAGIHSSCGTGWQLLATAASSNTNTQKTSQEFSEHAAENLNSQKDLLQAFEIVDQEFIPVSPSINFNGSINALWTHSNHSDVTAVVHNSTAGDYEAYQLTIACGQ